VAIARGLFDGPGGLSDETRTLESFLAREVEAPAALAIRDVCNREPGQLRDLPQPLIRYLAWAASRSLSMRQLAARWVIDLNDISEGSLAESPPEGLPLATRVNRPVRLVHPVHGGMILSVGEDASSALDQGWVPDMRDRDNFLEFVHVQASYFQNRWFPRLRWFSLRPPPDRYFVLGDRAAGWGVPGRLNAPPNCLRDPRAFLIAPLSRSLVLVARNSSEPWSVTPEQVNAMAAAWASDWIVGPTRVTVADALRDSEFLRGPSP
jgi:hypothetical protein